MTPLPRCRMLGVLFVACLAPVPNTPAPRPAPVVGKGFAVVSVTTDLHRRLIPAGDAKLAAVVFLDGAAVHTDRNALDLDAVGWKDLREALAAHRPAKDAWVNASVRFSQGDRVPANGFRVLNWTVNGLGRDAGFDRVRLDHAYSVRFAWDDFVAPLREADDAKTAESAEGDDAARVYPVRTALGRMLVGPIDGWIDVRVPLDGGKDWDTTKPEESVRKALARLRLPAGAKVQLRFDVRNRADNTTDRLQRLGESIARDNKLEYAGVSY